MERKHLPDLSASAATEIPRSSAFPPSSQSSSSRSPPSSSSSALPGPLPTSAGSSVASAPPSSPLLSISSGRPPGVGGSAVPPAAETSTHQGTAACSRSDAPPSKTEPDDLMGNNNTEDKDKTFRREYGSELTSSARDSSNVTSSANAPSCFNSPTPSTSSYAHKDSSFSTFPSTSGLSLCSSASSCSSSSLSSSGSPLSCSSSSSASNVTAPKNAAPQSQPSPPSLSPLQTPAPSCTRFSSSSCSSSSAASSRSHPSLSSSSSSFSTSPSSYSSSAAVASSAPTSSSSRSTAGVSRPDSHSKPPLSHTYSSAGASATQDVKPKKKLKLLSALPHTSHLITLRAAALRQHILACRKQDSWDGRVTRTATKVTDLNVFWKEIAVDLDDDGTRCDICGNYDATADDQILLCDGCDVAAHQTCYGVPAVPEGEWFCQFCAVQRQVQANVRHAQQVAARAAARAVPADRSRVEATLKGEVERMEKEGQPLCLLPNTCPLCPRRFGAHMQCSEGGNMWVHVNCIVWLPEGWLTEVRDCGGMMDSAAWRFEETCGICGIDEGAVVKCAAAGCTAVFHPVCCLMAGGGMNLTGQIPLRRENDVSFHAFCVRHRGKAFEESVDAEEPLEFNTRHPDSCHPFIRAAHLARRNRDILFYAAQCHKEKSTWGLCMGAYLIRELNENLVAFRMLWQRLADACNTSVPPSLPAGSRDVDEEKTLNVEAQSSL